MTRSRRVLRNFFAHNLLTVVAIFSGLLVTPYVLQTLGKEAWGAFRTMLEWMGYLSLLELGLFGALLPLLSRVIIDRDHAKLKELMKVSLALYALIAVLGFMVGLCLWPLWSTVIPASVSLQSDIQIGMLILLLSWLAIIYKPFQAYCDAAQKSYRVHIVFALQAIVIAGTSVLFAHHGLGVRGQSLAYALGTGFSFILFAAIVLRKTGFGILRWPFMPSVKLISYRHLWKLNAPTFLHDILGRACFQSDNIILALLLGPAVIAPFYLTQRLTALAVQQMQGIGGSSWAGFAELYRQQNQDIFAAKIIEMSKIITAVGISMGVPIFLYNQEFLILWVGEGHYAGHLLNGLALFNATALGLFSFWGWIFVGSGRIAQLVPVILCQTLLNVSASVALTFKLGLVGPVVGTTLGFIFPAISLPYLLQKNFAIRARILLWVWVKAIILASILILLILNGPLIVVQILSTGSWWLWMMKMLVTGAMVAIVSYGVLLDRRERESLKHKIQGIFIGLAPKV